MKISINTFHGESPRLKAHLLANEQAQVARDCDLRSGNLVPLKRPRTVSEISRAVAKTIHLFNARGTTTTWFEWDRDVDVLRGPIQDDTEERTYITGDGAPRVTFSSIATQGVDVPYPSNSYLLGVPAPTAAPYVSITGGSGSGFVGAVTLTDEGGIESIAVSAGGTGYDGVVGVAVKDNLPPEVDIPLTIVDGVITAVELPLDSSLMKEGRCDVVIVDEHKLGSGAEISMTWAGGILTALVLVDGGVGYPSATTAKIEAASGAGADIKAVSDDTGAITEVLVIKQGAKYYDPEITVTSSDVDTNALESSRVYTYTYVTGKGEEGPPAPASSLIDVLPGQNVNVEITRPTVVGSYDIEKVRIYRYAQGASSGGYFYVGEVLVGTENFIDDIDDVDLPGGLLASLDFDPPPEDMRSLTMLTNGVMAGAAGKEVCFCEPYLPYAWPVKYRLTVDYDIVGLGSLGNGVVVLTTGQPYVIMGNHPEVMGQDKLDSDQACISKRSIVSSGGAVLYASPDGLIMVSPNGTQNATEALFTQEQWQALKPETILGVMHEGKYIGFYEGGSFILDPRNPAATLTFSATTADSLYRDRMTDNLYITNGKEVQVWNDGDYGNTAWRSKRFTYQSPVNLSAIRLRGEGSAQVRVFADGVERMDAVLQAGQISRMPSGFLATDWEFEVGNIESLNSITASSSLAEMNHE